LNIPEIETPALLLDAAKLRTNIARMQEKAAAGSVILRPHMKTAKSIEVAREVIGDKGPVTVSTLKEAERFFAAGYTDILYAVGIVPAKLAHVSALLHAGADIKIILDSLAMATVVADDAVASGVCYQVMIEIDSDGHRSGLQPEAAELLEIAAFLRSKANVKLAGVLTHAGGSYGCVGTAALIRHAERERYSITRAAGRLRQAGFGCPIVSMGSTPTITFAESLDGITEVRAGVYMFQDLVMAGLGVCGIEDIAVSVLCTIVGHQHKDAGGGVVVDAGWMAMSRDRGTATQAVDQGYGLVCDAQGTPIADLIMTAANQEHGILQNRSGEVLDLSSFPIGSQLRILPNHACATSAQHDAYRLVGAEGDVMAIWPRFAGW